MDINKKIKNAAEAQSFAIDWQRWSAEQNLSYGEILEWQARFEILARKFNLSEEFKENGII